MKQIDINVQAAITPNRQPLSQTGSLLGHQFFTVEGRSCWNGGDEAFEKEKAEIAAGNNKGLILNRAPRRYQIKDHEIYGVNIMKDPITEDVVAAINVDDAGKAEITIPVGPNMVTMGKTTGEAVAAALRGEKNNFFLNGSELVDLVNRANKQEINYLDKMIDALSKIKQTVLNAIIENEKKAKASADEWAKSAVAPDMSDVLGGKAQGVIVVKNDD